MKKITWNEASAKAELYNQNSEVISEAVVKHQRILKTLWSKNIGATEAKREYISLIGINGLGYESRHSLKSKIKWNYDLTILNKAIK